MRRSSVPVLAAIVACLPVPAAAADFGVTRLDDPLPDACAPDDCSLREAVNAVQAAAGADRVLLPAGTITLDYDAGLTFGTQTGGLLVDTPIEFVGAGRDSTTITSPAALPVLLAISLAGPSAAVTLSDLAIANVAIPSGMFGPITVVMPAR